VLVSGAFIYLLIIVFIGIDIKKIPMNEKNSEMIDVMKKVMILHDNVVFEKESTEDLFNQYKDINTVVDLENASETRVMNLYNYCKSFSKRPPVLLIGEAAGYNGCRFSGIAFTSETQLEDGSFFLAGSRSSKGDLRKEISASIFWKNLERHHDDFFVCNAIPLHPHDPESILSNRTPRKTELDDFVHSWLERLLEILEPERVGCIGRKAQKCMEMLGFDVESIYHNEYVPEVSYIRHPARGGATKFWEGMKMMFD
jgi:hypothetical protein